MSQGGSDTCGIDNGKLYCWGYNEYGELGLGNTTQKKSPTQVGSLTTWTAISIQNNSPYVYNDTYMANACGIAGGKLYCWGQNANGEDGLGNTTAYKTPQQVGTATNWTSISYGADGYDYLTGGGGDACGVSGGSLYCWGRGDGVEDGQGYGFGGPYTTPQLVQIGGMMGENATDELGEYTSPTSTATVNWFNNSPNNGPTALGFAAPTSVVLDPIQHHLFVSDTYNDRVMVYNLNTDNSIPTSSGGHTASYVLGQTSLTNATNCNLTQSGLCGPMGLAFDPVNQRLFVVDSWYTRVMVFNTASISTGMNASYVLGQSDFVSTWNLGSENQNAFTWGVSGLAFDPVNQRLFVADSAYSNRVLVFNVAPGTISNGEAASYVLGCTSWTGCAGGTSRSAMFQPYGLALDSVNQRLFVADTGNDRVLAFNVAPGTISNGENASYEFGQSNFTSNTAGGGQTGFQLPTGVAYDPNHSVLFVADSYNFRVLMFNVAPGTISSGENASFVVGAPDFSTDTLGITTQSGLDLSDGTEIYLIPSGLFYDPGSSRLFVGDTKNNRIMIFDGTTMSTPSQWMFIPGYD